MTTVLLVEDDATMRQLLKTLLELEGFQVVLFGEGSVSGEILDAIKKTMPDSILLDIHLRTAGGQEINGIDIMKQIKEDSKIGKIRVVMTSGMDMKDQCLEAGAFGFLLKPYMPDDLIALLRK